MKTTFFLLCCGLLTIMACNKEKALLNELSGDYSLTSISLQNDRGIDTVLVFPSLTMSFNDCDLTNNRQGGNCDLRVTDGGTTYTLRYQVVRGNGSNDDILTLNPAENPAGITERVDYQALQGSYTYDLNGDLLLMTGTAPAAVPFQIDGRPYLLKEITAQRR